MRKKKIGDDVAELPLAPTEPVGDYRSEENEHSPIEEDHSMVESEDTVDMSGAEMPTHFQRIITYQFRPIDEHEEYQELRAYINSDKRLSSLQFGELVDELDKAQNRAHRAAELAARMHIVHARYMFDLDVIEAALRNAVIKRLEAEKKKSLQESGTKGKQITNGDVDAYILANFPDEVDSIRKKRIESKESSSLFDDLAIRLAERAKDLRAIVTRTRAVD